MAEKFDDVLVPFVSLMRKELHANTGKGDRPGWLRMDANTALLEVYWHAAKLSAAVKNNDGPAIMEHSADVANMAMMVLDVCGGLAWVDAAAGVPESCADIPPAAAPLTERQLGLIWLDLSAVGIKLTLNEFVNVARLVEQATARALGVGTVGEGNPK